jgi:hypothetical protein
MALIGFRIGVAFEIGEGEACAVGEHEAHRVDGLRCAEFGEDGAGTFEQFE